LSLFVDTSVWSLAFRRDAPPPCPQVRALTRALEGGETIIGTGLVLQELLQGFSGPKAREAILNYFSALPLLTPSRRDHIEAAEAPTLADARVCNLEPSTRSWLSSASATI
jgi:predicted nucleic acid-binding protein